ncbi:MAG TPA: methionine--tRNA ligase [Candidatus Limnocylindrales bacterium]|nr:methionine--tRNA ligase [Candidatus Limnocylindrales bacterium]
MTDRSRFYLTTSIAYANNRPGLHTLYEVIAADVIARWYRMNGVPTRFLTGTDEHSLNIPARAAEQGKNPKQFVDEIAGLFQQAEAELLITPDRFIRTTDPDHRLAAQEMIRRAYAAGDIYQGTYEGWYCPSEGFRADSDLVREGDTVRCPNHPTITLEWVAERNWFFRLSAYQERIEQLFAERPDFVQPEYRRNEMLAFIGRGLEDFSISREHVSWGLPFPIREDGSAALLPDGSPDVSAGRIYVWFDALTNYITGAGFPADMDSFAKWWPADVHIIGKDINRFHSIYWPAMLMSAGLEPPRSVFVHGFLTVQGERMSKSLGNLLDPSEMVRAFGPDGARYVVLREVPFDRDADVSWDSFVRRYNADLANDFGNLLNRSLTMTARFAGVERPAPRPAVNSDLGSKWAATWAAVTDRVERYLLHDALTVLWDFVGEANRFVDREQPWVLAKAALGGDQTAADRLHGALGDLLEACRLVALASAPFMPAAAERAYAQLGLPYGYGGDGNGGPRLAEQAGWGAAAAGSQVGAQEILFPRVEIEGA